MKRLYFLSIIFLFVATTSFSQPQICKTPPTNYEVGGDFDLYTTNLGVRSADDYFCMNDRSQVVRIEASDKSNLTDVRYIFGLDQTHTILPVIPRVTFRDVDGSSSGDFWVIQWGKLNNRNVLSCKVIRIDLVEKPNLNIKACNEKSIELNVDSKNIISDYRINWGDGETETASNAISQMFINHEYKKIPQNNISVFAIKVNKSNGKSCMSPPAELVPPHKFRIQKLTTFEYEKDMSATLEYPNMNSGFVNLEYSVEKKDDYQSANEKLLLPGVAHQLPKMEACFRLKYSNSPACVYVSPQVCSIKAESKFNQTENNIKINWNKVNNLAIYEIFRQDSLIHTESMNQFQFFDDKLGCKERYDYQVVGKYKDVFNEDVVVKSSKIGVLNEFKTVVKPVSTLVATYQTNNVVLNFSTNEKSDSYEIYRYPSSSFTENSTISNKEPFFEVIDPYNEQVCYHIKAINSCGLSSNISHKACTIYLEANDRILTWNKPVEIPNAFVVYRVKNLSKRIEEETQENQYNIIQANTAVERYQVIATITYTTPDGKQLTLESKSNIVQIEPNGGIYLPNAFSPNSDGNNDTFLLIGDLSKVSSCKFSVFDRWGALIYESNDVDFTWDGTIDGVPIEKGLYTYNLSVVYKDRHSELKNGTLLLIR